MQLPFFCEGVFSSPTFSLPFSRFTRWRSYGIERSGILASSFFFADSRSFLWFATCSGAKIYEEAVFTEGMQLA